MSVSRRRFLRSGAMAAVTAGFLLEPLVRVRGESKSIINHFGIAGGVPLFNYGRSTFEPYIGGIFTARDAAGKAVKLRLGRVTGYTPNPRTRISTAKCLQTDCFSLFFEASRELPPTSSTHAIEHPKLGTFPLFLSRADVKGHIYYEAVIHRLV